MENNNDDLEDLGVNDNESGTNSQEQSPAQEKEQFCGCIESNSGSKAPETATPTVQMTITDRKRMIENQIQLDLQKRIAE